MARETTLVDGAERQYGIANLNYSDYVMERLESLAFKWTEIASILGISRMTLYRYFHELCNCVLFILTSS